ncbi:Cysteine--tRNA ligase [uncultured archaeon]|nr:Cysteine--tRNA ligase [uncultured archaeon]
MALKVYNTLTRKKEIFKPVKEKEVRMYVCGPTVNDIPHLGHARSQISFDVLRKYLIYSGYKVKFVSNITDIEDKIINKANELGISIKELTEKNEKSHLEDYEKIGVSKPDIQPHATQHVKQMIELVKKLEEKGYTYIIPEDGVYYNISKFKKYGKLSHQNVKDLKTGARKLANEEKKNKEDFVLWKFSKSGEPSWDSPWGKGRPGWHIECSAMSESILGLPLDIHGGGQDLIFPHHEDEIAQSEAAFDKKFANYWVHNGMVNVEKVKMSKSLGNFKTIRDLLKDYPGEVIRYFVISNQYRKPVDFSKSTLDQAKVSYERLKNLVQNLTNDGKENKDYLKEFEKAMDDDLNTPKALAELWKLVRDEKAHGKIKTIEKIDSIFCLNLLKKEKVEVPKEVQKIVDERNQARKNKDWKKSDELRDKIKSLGYSIDDTAEGTKVKKI